MENEDDGGDAAIVTESDPSVELERAALAKVEQLLDLSGDDRAAELNAIERDNPPLASAIRRLMSRDPDASSWMPTEAPGLWESEEDRVPDRIGPFVITGTLGRGGMGVVLRGERDDALFDQVVAIKLMRAGIVSLHQHERFILERQILARLDSPAICRILDGGVWEGRPFLIMDYVDGFAVTTYAAAKGLDLGARLALFMQVCGAVQYAHRQLIVHADLKPSNIMVTQDGQIKLLDFGIARLIDDEGDRAYANPTRGSSLTRAYAPPERRDGARPTIEGDVFSLGAILFELLTGRVMRRGEGEAVPLASNVGASSPVSPNAVSGDLDAIIVRATAPEVLGRYPDVAALIADIQAWKDGYPVAARPVGRHQRIGKFVRRHTRGLALATALIFLLAGAAIVSTIEAVRAERARKEANARFTDARGAANYLLFDQMEHLSNRPNSLKLRSEVAGVAQRYLDRLAASADAPLAVRRELAMGLWRLANAQGVSGHANLGQPEAANANLARAEAIASALPGRDGFLLLADIQLDRARTAMDLQFDQAQARVTLDRAKATIEKVSGNGARLRCDYLLSEAKLANWKADYAAGERFANAARTLRPPGEDSAAVLILTAIDDALGEAIYYARGPVDAEPIYRRQAAALLAAHQRWPSNNYVTYWLSRSRWNLAVDLLDQKRAADALPVITAAKEDAAAALVFDPDDYSVVRNDRIIRTAYAQILTALGRRDEGLTQLMAILGRDRARSATRPNDTKLLRDVAYDSVVLGEALDKAGRGVEACAADRQARSLYDKVRRRGALSKYDATNNLKLMNERLGRNCKS